MDEEESPKPDKAEGKDDSNLLILERLIEKAGNISDPLKSAVKTNALRYLKAVYINSLTIKHGGDYQEPLSKYELFAQSLEKSEEAVASRNIDENEMRELAPVISSIEDALRIPDDKRIKITKADNSFEPGSDTNDPNLPSQE